LRTATGAARLFLVITAAMVVIKVAVGALTGGISLIAQAAVSGLCIVTVGVTFFIRLVARQPADRDHPFGHGKMENLAAVVQSFLTFLAVAIIVYVSIQHIRTGGAAHQPDFDIAVLGLSLVSSFLMYRFLLPKIRPAKSPAAPNNASMLKLDMYSTSLALIGMLAIQFTNWGLIDPAIAIVIAVLLVWMGINTLRKSFSGLVDVKLPEAEEKLIENIITANLRKAVNFHDLRTRMVGSRREIDLHLTVPEAMTVEAAHEICDRIENEILQKLPSAGVTIHIEPCDAKCPGCDFICGK